MFTAIRTQPGPALRSRSTTGRPTPVPSTASRHWPVRSGERVTCTTRSTTSVYGVPSAIRSRYRSCSDTTFFQANITASHSPFVSARSTAAIALKSLLCPKSTPTKYQSIGPHLPRRTDHRLPWSVLLCFLSAVGHALACQSEPKLGLLFLRASVPPSKCLLSAFGVSAVKGRFPSPQIAPPLRIGSPDHQRLDFIRDRALHQIPREYPAHRVLELAQVLLPEPPLPHRGELLFQM